jgi:hypothetical protein
LQQNLQRIVCRLTSNQRKFVAEIIGTFIVEPLIDWKFIRVEKIGAHHIVSLTDAGINALKFLHESK